MSLLNPHFSLTIASIDRGLRCVGGQLAALTGINIAGIGTRLHTACFAAHCETCGWCAAVQLSCTRLPAYLAALIAGKSQVASSRGRFRGVERRGLQCSCYFCRISKTYLGAAFEEKKGYRKKKTSLSVATDYGAAV